MLPALPTGSAIQSGAPPKTSQISKGGALLAFQAEGIERIDQGDGMLFGNRHHQAQGIVERAVDLDHFRAVGDRAGQLARGYFPGGNNHNGAHTRVRGIGSRGGGGVAGGSANDGFGAAMGGFADRHGHAAVLERTGGIQSLEFNAQVDVPAQAFGDGRHRDERRVAFQKRLPAFKPCGMFSTTICTFR